MQISKVEGEAGNFFCSTIISALETLREIRRKRMGGRTGCSCWFSYYACCNLDVLLAILLWTYSQLCQGVSNIRLVLKVVVQIDYIQIIKHICKLHNIVVLVFSLQAFGQCHNGDIFNYHGIFRAVRIKMGGRRERTDDTQYCFEMQQINMALLFCIYMPTKNHFICQISGQEMVN